MLALQRFNMPASHYIRYFWYFKLIGHCDTDILSSDIVVGLWRILELWTPGGKWVMRPQRCHAALLYNGFHFASCTLKKLWVRTDLDSRSSGAWHICLLPEWPGIYVTMTKKKMEQTEAVSELKYVGVFNKFLGQLNLEMGQAAWDSDSEPLVLTREFFVINTVYVFSIIMHFSVCNPGTKITIHIREFAIHVTIRITDFYHSSTTGGKAARALIQM